MRMGVGILCVCVGVREFCRLKEKLSVGVVVEINKNNIATHVLEGSYANCYRISYWQTS